MERTKKKEFKKADAILTSDWHLRENTPVCRTDNFYETQWQKLDFISTLQKQHDCDVLHAGDLFDYWKPSPMLLSKTMQHLPNRFYTIYGNHDLPQHNVELAYKCGINVLEKAGMVNVLEHTHWLAEPTEDSFIIKNRHICIWHVMTYQGKAPWPGCKAPMGAKLLRKYPDFDLILTGDNHKPFTEEHEGSLLVNPGSIFRMTAEQDTHKPRVYLYYAETNTVEPVYIPIDKNVITREHIEVKEQRDARIDAFISTLNEDWRANMSFEDNIENFRQANNVEEEVMQIIYEAIG